MKKFVYILTIVLLVAVAALAAACDRNVTLLFVSDGEQIASVQAKSGEDISDRLPSEPTRGGYVFEGWYLDPECNGERQVLPQTMPDSNATYYAKWSPEGQQTHTLTLTTGDGGTLAATSYQIASGANILQFLADKAPTPKTGLTFAGWYVGNRLLPDNATADYDLTLTAKYNATYTVTLHTMDTDGRYTLTSTQTGTAIYGESFNCGDALQVPEHFSLNTLAEGSRLNTSSLGVAEQFEAYLQRERYYVIFDANLPADVSYTGGEMKYYYYGTQITVQEDLMIPSRPYRLLGVSESQNGNIDVSVGDNFTVEGNTTLYGVWEKGYADMFGGGDQLYPTTGNTSSLRLRRTNMQDRFGFYDETTGEFYFTEDDTQNGTVVLNGRISGNYFYYYRDVLEKSYPDLDGSEDTLTIAANGKTIYVHDGERIEGDYTVDVDSGYFRFVPDDGSSENTFLFNLFESTADGSVVYRRQHLEEAGLYASSDGCVIELDGLGGLTYRYNNSNYVYQVGNSPVLEVYGYYEWQEENNFFLGYVRDAVSILFELVFTIDRQTPVTSVEGYNFDHYDGRIERDDGNRGTFTDKFESTDNQLYLDGFGNGVFGDVEGEYQIINWLYVYLDEETEADVTAEYMLVRFMGEDGTIYYFRLDTEYGDFEVDRIIAQADVKQELSDQFGKHEFDNVYVYGTWYTGFVYVFENGGAEMWTAYAQVSTGEYAFVLYTEFVSTVTPQQDDTFLFGTQENGIPTEGSFTFELDSQGKLTQVFPEEQDIVEVMEGLILNRTTGQAFYTPDGDEQNRTEVYYLYTLGYVDYYIFLIDDEYRNFVHYVDDDGTEHFDEVVREDVLTMYYEAIDGYTARLLFANDTVYLGVLVGNNMYRYIGQGTCTKVAGKEGQFDFVLNDWLSSEYPASDLGSLTQFRYIVVTEQTSQGVASYFIQQEDSAYTYSNFTSDGYGNYTFTDDAGKTIVGELGEVLSDENGTPLLIYLIVSDNEYIFTVEGDRVVNVTNTDAGYWYEMNDNQRISLYAYFVFDGRGNAYYYLIDTLTYVTRQTVGTYRRTDRWTSDFREYEVQTEDGGSFYNSTTEISRVLLGSFTVSDGTQLMELPLYQRLIPHRVGDYDVQGGGHITSAGYTAELATYRAADGTLYRGNMYLGKVATGGTTGPSFINGADGATTVHFWVVEGNALGSTHFYFELVGNRLIPHTLTFGDYAYFDGDVTHTDTYIRLGGGGSAAIYNGIVRVESGSYTRVEELDAYRYTSSTQSFVFRLGYDSSSGDDVYVYYKYAEQEDNLYLSTTDWSSLDIDGFGSGTYVDNYGRVYNGYVVMFDEAKGYGYFGASGLSRVFVIDNDAHTFYMVDHSAHAAAYYSDDFSAFVLDDAMLTIGGKQYYYLTDGATITAYPVGGGETLTLPLPTGASYNYLDKTYYRWNGEAITFTDNEFGVELTLIFTPNGATFSTAASLNGNRTDYTINVGYGANGIAVTLTYYTGQMDTLSETYAVTLHYDGSQRNTFTVTPGGLNATFTDSEHDDSSIKIDGRRVGHVVVGTKQVEYNLKYITDTQNNPLVVTGSFDDIEQSIDGYTMNYGYIYIARVTAQDGIRYTLMFYLDSAQGKVILQAVTVDKTFEVADAGSVTIAQLWYDAGMYNNYVRYDIVSISLPEDGVTTTTYQSAIEGGSKAALVRQVLNTTSGAYTYEAYVFNVSYGSDKFVSDLSVEGKYLYGEASQNGETFYMVRFLYTNENGRFTVRYVLTFTVGTSLQRDAAFESNGDNAYTVTAGGKQYRIVIRTYGSSFALIVTA